MIILLGFLWVLVGLVTCILANKYSKDYNLNWNWSLLGPILTLSVLLNSLQIKYDKKYDNRRFKD